MLKTEGMYQSKRFGDQGPRPKELLNNKASQYGLDLRYTAVSGIDRILLYQNAGAKSKEYLNTVSEHTNAVFNEQVMAIPKT